MTDEEARQAKNFFVETNWIAPDKNASKFTKNIYEWIGFLTKELNRVEEVVTKEFKIVEEAILDLRREKDALRSENEQLKKAMKQNNEGLSWASKLAIN
jgi:hypothetical protein